MEDTMHTKDFLAAELLRAGLPAMAKKAAAGYYHDFLSPLDAPCQQLAHDLGIFANAASALPQQRAAAKALLARHMAGEFDASHEESEAWAASQEGREAFAGLTRPSAHAEIHKTASGKYASGPQPITPQTHEQIGRLALRVEGAMWNAYYMLPDSQVDAALLASIALAAVQSPARRQQFVALMREVIADIIERASGHRPVWGGEHPAAEHERGGHA
jgi:hypothetical protein